MTSKTQLKKQQVATCLDEIEASFLSMEESEISDKGISQLKSWVRENKATLKELKYSGKMPRKKRGS
jgi:hypothetical protein